MSYQKLQVRSALEVCPSDTANIPNTSSKPASGITTGGPADKLVDSSASFLSTVKVGDIVYNTTDSTAATVTAIDTDVQLSISSNIAQAGGKAYQIYRGDQGGCVLYVGVGGNVKVTTSGGDTVSFYNLNNGQFVPVQVSKVFSTGTTATNLIALW